MSVDVHPCATTGMALVPASQQILFRLAKPSFGPLNPRRRSISSSDDRTGWNRFDIAGEQTIYAACSPEGAYGELLGSLKKPRGAPAARYLDDTAGATIDELIEQDWVAAGRRLPPYAVDLNWLFGFRLYMLTLPSSGWLVEVEHSRTVGYLEQHIPCGLWERGMKQVTVAELRSPDRSLTTLLAEQVANVRLADGTQPIGIRYGSKHGSDWTCWTVWLRDSIKTAIDVDDGMAIAPRPAIPH
ncbi:hypothetical protein [Mycobacterium sp. P7213]|uniref:hypothetical protein n=1 Tax=Mycobacterium sp. P7213 TaxID=2478465 RepID=UPI000F634969|nr:hypothetical protein [Mycobacterium sp. P7213]